MYAEVTPGLVRIRVEAQGSSLADLQRNAWDVLGGFFGNVSYRQVGITAEIDQYGPDGVTVSTWRGIVEAESDNTATIASTLAEHGEQKRSKWRDREAA